MAKMNTAPMKYQVELEPLLSLLLIMHSIAYGEVVRESRYRRCFRLSLADVIAEIFCWLFPEWSDRWKERRKKKRWCRRVGWP